MASKSVFASSSVVSTVYPMYTTPCFGPSFLTVIAQFDLYRRSGLYEGDFIFSKMLTDSLPVNARRGRGGKSRNNILWRVLCSSLIIVALSPRIIGCTHVSPCSSTAFLILVSRILISHSNINRANSDGSMMFLSAPFPV